MRTVTMHIKLILFLILSLVNYGSNISYDYSHFDISLLYFCVAMYTEAIVVS